MSDVLETMDAAIDGRCACLCGAAITDRSPSAYFASERCSQLWRVRNGPARLTDAEQIRAALQQLAEALHKGFRDLAAALRPFFQMCRDMADAATQALPDPPVRTGPRNGPPTRRRAPKALTPSTGWHSHARSARRPRPRPV